MKNAVSAKITRSTWLILLVSACTVYRPVIYQGQGIELETVNQLSEGMSRQEVLDVMGTPLIADTFHRNRWDYVYYVIDNKRQVTRQQRLTVFFENDLLTRVEHDIPPASDSIDAAEADSEDAGDAEN